MKEIINNIYHSIANIKSAIVIHETNEKALPWDSKIGGKPYLLEDDDYPLSHENEPFKFILQINLKDLPENEYFPKHGLLQFFLNLDYSYDEDDQPFLVKYIPRITRREERLDYDEEDDYQEYDDEEDELDLDEKDEFNFMEDDEEEEFNEYGMKIFFTLEEDHINPTTLEWDTFIDHLASCLYNYRNELDDYDGMIEDEVNYLEDLDFILDKEEVITIRYANKLLGYPSNEQEDIRLRNKDYEHYLLLLQYTIINDDDEEQLVKWFIDPIDLENKDFTKVICSYYK
ncbi:MAG: DUF1963 domain-containing protein [Bacilli bacterium]|jgi:uncharacterized protein YwqG|nr:DUF1963 domain-containing protein [Bacilli bacterium]